MRKDCWGCLCVFESHTPIYYSNVHLSDFVYFFHKNGYNVVVNADNTYAVRNSKKSTFGFCTDLIHKNENDIQMIFISA